MNIIAIDPGTAHTGLVYMDERRIITCKTLAYGHAVKQDQYKLQERAAVIAKQITEWMADKPHGIVVIEGFVSFGATRNRVNSSTYQTPYLCGFLHSALEEETIVIQTSDKVFGRRSRGNVADLRDLMAKGHKVYPGCELCTNEHLRSAACHGIYYFDRQRQGRLL